MERLTHRKIRKLDYRAVKIAMLVVSCLLMSVQPVKAAVEVTFNDPVNFTDIQSSDRSRKQSAEMVTKELTRFLELSEEKFIKNGHNLKIEFLDIDRAGEIRYGSMSREMRVLRDTVLIRLKFNYTLEDESGNVLKQGEENLKSFETVGSIESRGRNSDAFYFEKKELSKWLSKLY